MGGANFSMKAASIHIQVVRRRGDGVGIATINLRFYV